MSDNRTMCPIAAHNPGLFQNAQQMRCTCPDDAAQPTAEALNATIMLHEHLLDAILTEHPDLAGHYDCADYRALIREHLLRRVERLG
jgi:hypothetical protein